MKFTAERILRASELFEAELRGDDLKAEAALGCNLNRDDPGDPARFAGKTRYLFSLAYARHFASEIPLFARNRDQVCFPVDPKFALRYEIAPLRPSVAFESS